MTLIRVRRTCEVGESCPMIAFDTQTRAAIIVGTPDPAAAAELGLPSHEIAIRVTEENIPRLLYGLGPDTFPEATS